MRSALVVAGVLVAVFLGLGLVLPDWIVFQLGLALSRGLVVLGVVLLMRGGLVSFGQALFFAAGAYGAGLAVNRLGIQDAVVLAGLGLVAGLGVALLAGLLLVRYREIFFAMLSLAFSMVFYGLVLKFTSVTGGSDGMSVGAGTILGVPLSGPVLRLGLYAFTVICTAVALLLVYAYVKSPSGYAMRAISDNELRVGYLGVSVERVIYLTFALAGALGGLGGALVALSVEHIDPSLAFWTTSAEFVVVAVLGGTGNVLAPMSGAVIFQLARTYALKYAPSTWRLMLGVILLAIVLFMPGGLWTFYEATTRRLRTWLLSWRQLV